MDNEAPPTKKSKLEEPETTSKPHALRPIPAPSTATSNVEDTPVALERLSQSYPELKKFISTNTNTGVSHFDFMSDESVRLYNQALLGDWFGIKIDLPSNHLCPTALSRTRYIRWIAELTKHCSRSQEVVGIDVGTGASCVYPLIGHAIYGWKFISSDVDEESLQWASKNVKLNEWTNSITVVRAKKLTEKDGHFNVIEGLLDADAERNVNGGPTYSTAHFTMCNPPYFDSPEDKYQRDDTVCVATDGELAIAGGELEFVRQMIRESVAIGARIGWYTTLLGRKVNLKPLLRYLQTFPVLDVQHTTFIQGKNARWAIAWTFDPVLKASVVAERFKSIRYKDRKFVFESSCASLDALEEALSSLPIDLRFRRSPDSPAIFNATAYANSTWITSMFAQQQESDESRSASAVVSAGPMGRPATVFTLKMTASRASHSTALTLACEMGNGSMEEIILGDFKCAPEHVFGVMMREIKDLIGL